MDLLYSRLVLMRLSVLLEMWRRPWAILGLREETIGDGLSGLG